MKLFKTPKRLGNGEKIIYGVGTDVRRFEVYVAPEWICSKNSRKDTDALRKTWITHWRDSWNTHPRRKKSKILEGGTLA